MPAGPSELLTADPWSTRRGFVKLCGTVASLSSLSSWVALTGVTGCKTLDGSTSRTNTNTNTTGTDAVAAADDFVAVSRTLTGEQDLDPTLAAPYLADLRAKHGDGPVQALLALYKTLALEGGDVEDAFARELAAQDLLGAVAASALMLWYTGVFQTIEVQQTVAVDAYQKALVWPAFGGKPTGVPGTAPGAWATPPAGS